VAALEIRRRERVAGVDAHWREAGAGEPLVVLHGLGASSFSWTAVMPALARRYRVIAPDFPGFGRSDSPREFDYSLKGLSRWVVALLDHLGLPSAHVAGNSLGGIVALMTAMDEPARVRRVALLGTPTHPGDGPLLLWPLRWPVVGRLYELALGPVAVRYIGRTAYKDPSLMTDEKVEEYALPLRTAAGRWAAAEVLRRAVPADARERVERYRQLPHEFLVICGESDTVAGLESSRRFCEKAPRARLLELRDCAHVPQEERPEQVAAAFEEFFQ